MSTQPLALQPMLSSTERFGGSMDSYLNSLRNQQYADGTTVANTIVQVRAAILGLVDLMRKPIPFVDSDGNPITIPTPVPVPSNRISVIDYGAIGDGVADDTAAILAGYAAILALNGGELYFPGGHTYSCDQIALPAGATPVMFSGDGDSSVITRRGAITTGQGWWDISQGNVYFKLLKFDGGVTTPVGVNYSAITGGNPMAAVLSDDTSFWVHGGISNFWWDRVTVEHTGGYAILFDTTGVDEDLTDVVIQNCTFSNNRPHLFGTAALDLTYGSWTGGIHCQSDSATKLGVTKRMYVSGCSFQRNTGNCVWEHAYGFLSLHEQIHVTSNNFLDCGLDGVLMGNVLGGSVTNNSFRRIGYTTVDDTTASVPKWLVNLNATALDTSGIVKNVVYGNNRFLSVNGGCINGDGLCYSTVVGNVGRIPIAGDPEYTDDAIATFGPLNSGDNWVQGIVIDNSALMEGGSNVTVTGNRFDNCGGCNLGFYCSRNCSAMGNTFAVPNAPKQPPAAFGNKSTNALQRANGNVMVGNTFVYSPSSDQPCIWEDGSVAAFSVGDKNWVAGNVIISTTDKAFEFLKDANTSSTTATVHSTNADTVISKSAHAVQREGIPSDNSSALKWYLQEGTSQWSHMQLQGSYKAGARGPLLNVSEAGVGGVVATGAVATTVFHNCMATGKQVSTAFNALTNTTYLDADANLLDDTWALLRYDKTIGHIEQSIATLAGARVWVPLAGASIVAGTDGQVQFNQSGAFGAGNKLTWDRVNQKLTVTGITATPGLEIVSSYVKSAEGFLTLNTATDSIQAPNGGVFGAWLIAKDSVIFEEEAAPALSATGQTRLYMDSTSKTVKISMNNGAYAELVGSGGLSGLTAERIPFAASASSLSDSAGLTWDHINNTLRVTGGTGTPGVKVFTSYVDSAEGFLTASSAVNSFQSLNGGFSGKYLYTSESLFFAEAAAPALPSSGQSKIYMDSSTHLLMVSQNGTAAIPLIVGGLSGLTSGRIPYTTSATGVADTANLLWNNTNQLLTINGKTGQPALYLPLGYVSSHQGFLTDGTNTDIIQAASGGVTAKWLIATDSVFLIEEVAPALSSTGQSRIYMDSTTHSLLISQNGGAYGSLQALSGLTSGRIPYTTGSSSITDSTYLQWNNTTKLMTVQGSILIGSSALGGVLDVTGTEWIYTNGVNNIGLVIKGYPSQASNLLEMKNSSSTNLAWFSPLGVMFFTQSNAASSSTSYGSYGSDGIQLQQTVGDEASCGRILYRGFGAAALTIVGCGTTGGSRQILLYDIAIANSKMWVARTTDDASGAVLQVTGYGNSSVGWATSGTNTDALKAGSGGVTVKWLIGTVSLSLSTTSIGTAGTAAGRMIFDGSYFYVCEDGSNYVRISTGGGGSGLGYSSISSGRIPYSDSSSSVTSTANLAWSNSQQTLTVSGYSGYHAIICQTTGVQSPYLSVPNGLYAATVFSAYITLSAVSAPSGAGSYGILYYKTSSNKFYYNENNGGEKQAFGGVSGSYNPAGISTMTIVDGRVTGMA